MAAQCAADQQGPLMSRLQSSYVVSYSTISTTPGTDQSVVDANICVWKVCSHAAHDHQRSVHRPDAAAWAGPLLADFYTDAGGHPARQR